MYLNQCLLSVVVQNFFSFSSPQAREVLTLKLGASKAPHHDKSGQVLSMDWLPEKPHNIMAIGFYDGTTLYVC